MPIEDIKTKEGTTTRFAFPPPITGTAAAMDKTPPPEAIIPGICWRGATSLISGAPKSGKSTLLRDWIRRIGKARFNENLHHQFVLPDRLVRAANILYFSEEAPFAWNAFFQEMQADKVCYAARSSEGENLSDFDWFRLFDRRHSGIAPLRADERSMWVDAVIEVVNHFDIDMVVLDPITRFLALTSENDNSEVLSAMMEVERIASEGNCALMMIHHTGKAGGQARGASAFLQNVDAILTLRKGRKSPRLPTRSPFGSWRVSVGMTRSNPASVCGSMVLSITALIVYRSARCGRFRRTMPIPSSHSSGGPRPFSVRLSPRNGRVSQRKRSKPERVCQALGFNVRCERWCKRTQSHDKETPETQGTN